MAKYQVRMGIECAKGNSPECPSCGNWNALLDVLGRDSKEEFEVHFKCRDCGFTIPKNETTIIEKEADRPGMGNATTYHVIRKVSGENY